MKQNIAIIGLLILGLAQMLGDLTGFRALKGVAAATGASPAPKVFSSVRGLETFSSKFYLEWTTPDGEAVSKQITSKVYSQLRGPYNRRNVYGACLAYGPVLPETLRAPISRYAFSGDAPILKELGIDPEEIDGTLRIRIEPKQEIEGLPLIFEEVRQ